MTRQSLGGAEAFSLCKYRHKGLFRVMFEIEDQDQKDDHLGQGEE
jgi:hypothetical protein